MSFNYFFLEAFFLVAFFLEAFFFVAFFFAIVFLPDVKLFPLPLSLHIRNDGVNKKIHPSRFLQTENLKAEVTNWCGHG